MTNVRFGFWHKVRQRKKHFCLLRCLSAFATPIKFYFDVFFKLLPYVALALMAPPFYLYETKRLYTEKKKMPEYPIGILRLV